MHFKISMLWNIFMLKFNDKFANVLNILQMYQRRDKNEKVTSGNSEGILDLFRLLESTDPEEVESVKNVIHENLSTGI